MLICGNTPFPISNHAPPRSRAKRVQDSPISIHDYVGKMDFVLGLCTEVICLPLDILTGRMRTNTPNTAAKERGKMTRWTKPV